MQMLPFFYLFILAIDNSYNCLFITGLL